MECLNTGNHVVIQPQSCLDQQGGQVLIQKLTELIQDNTQLLIVDMAEVDFIDSAGLGALVNILKAARQQGCELVLCHISNTVKLILEITQLDQVFKVSDELDTILSADSALQYA